MSSAGISSATPSISDLDGYTFRDYQFPASSTFAPVQLEDDEFGFDPPQKPLTTNDYQVYSPPDDYPMSQWPEFDRDDDLKVSTENPLNVDNYEMDKFITSVLPNPSTAIARYGQMTPPRSNSTASTDSKEEKLSPKSQPLEPQPRKRGKGRPKATETASSPSKTTTTAGRKRKATRKSSTTIEQGDSAEEQKRKQSLEKNRLAAAKCRINKKEKTERLQRDSQEKAIENAYLKDQIMRMKDEIQQMNAILVAHGNCEGCKSPEEIQAHLNALGNDFFSQQLALASQNFGEFPPVNFTSLPVMPDNFFAGTTDDQILHPPLPEFNRSAEFEVHTPAPTD
ncbi:uncharacterized protein Z520_01838 [Fonsecaea multimorphosa CBS 102226]|uniref:BZIP domain-containing protein n=1 Tax=Fonsecaea multimorphosa CBS 102226 TaxID=1442371 RepID=A0A0D2KEC9_9EURO|nr:uncharacterized protein Z520_01838 [Fonsecaea multimorphosa CBS 102226]KIY01700.1 hypothetical protein Z520_01838 [Fonsecaea multimorphosa CBS 102226]OAL29895.1 hypothetical protein AYO22_01801 [Fonsecaea multimorphosa]